jgi:protein SCO1/2
MRRLPLIFGSVALGVAAILAAILLYGYGAKAPDGASVVGGPFKLASANGRIVDTEALKGHPYGVFFGFTHCPEVCPTTLYDMAATLAQLGDEAKDFRLYFITVDPERDTVAVLKDYVGNFDPRIEALVPTPEELKQVAQSFRAYYDREPTSDGSYTMNHTAMVYLMDRDGKFAGIVSYGEKPEMRLDKLRKLLAG